MCAAAVSHAEMTGGEMQWIAGENVSRPRSRATRQNDGIDPLAAIKSYLRANQRRSGRSAVRVVASSHVDFDIAKAMLGKMGFQRGERLVGFHVRHEAKIELGDGAVGKNRLAARTGVAANEAFDVDSGTRLQQFKRLLVIHVVNPVLDAKLFLGDVFFEAARGVGA